MGSEKNLKMKSRAPGSQEKAQMTSGSTLFIF